MDILIIGRWVFLALGIITIIGALIITFKNPEPFKRILFTWIFGVFLAGTGVFGLEFIPKYKDWLDTLLDMIKNPSKESYETFLAKVGNGEIPIELQELGITYAINNPIEGIEGMLTTAINNAPANTQGKKALEWAKDSYLEKQRVIDQLVKSNPSVEDAKRFDPSTSKMLYRKLIELPQSEIRKYGIDQKQLNRYKPTPKPFPGKKIEKPILEEVEPVKEEEKIK